MPRLKRTASKVIQNAAARAAGMESIDPLLDLGGEMTLADFKDLIAFALERQASYNTLLAASDEAKFLLEAAEYNVSDRSERMLAAVAAKYGRDSNEYQMGGGRRRPIRRRAAGTVAPVPSAIEATPAVAKAAA